MAWIITLALFWGIGSLLCRKIDKRTAVQYERKKEERENHDFFFASIYVMAWYYYQQLEPQVLNAWAEIPGGGPERANFPASIQMEKFSEQIFGEPITHKAIKTALQRRSELGWPIYVPAQTAQAPYDRGWTLSDSQWIDFDTIASALISKIPNLGSYYQWSMASQVERGPISEYIPPHEDPRTFEYRGPMYFNGKIQWRTQRRTGAPADCDKAIYTSKKKYEIQR